MFCFFKVDLNALFVKSTPASVWTLVGFRPISFSTFRNVFNTVGRANPIFESISMILNMNVSPSLNSFLATHIAQIHLPLFIDIEYNCLISRKSLANGFV